MRRRPEDCLRIAETQRILRRRNLEHFDPVAGSGFAHQPRSWRRGRGLFTSARTICNLLKQIPQLVQLPLSRELSSLAGQRRKAEFNHLHRVFMATTLLIAVAILGAIYTRGSWLLGFWSHGRLQVDPLMLRGLALSVFFESNIYAWVATVLAKNENSGVSKIQFSCAVLMSLLTAVLLPKAHLLAAPIALLAVFLIVDAPLLLSEAVGRDDLSWPWALKNMVLPTVLA